MNFQNEDGSLSAEALHVLCHTESTHIQMAGASMAARSIRGLAQACLLLMGERNELKAELDRLWKGRTS